MARLGAFNLDSVQKAQTNQMQRLLMAKSSSSLPGQSFTSKGFLGPMMGSDKSSGPTFKKGRKF